MKTSKVEPMSWRDWVAFFVSAAAYAAMFWYGLVIETGGF